MTRFSDRTADAAADADSAANRAGVRVRTLSTLDEMREASALLAEVWQLEEGRAQFDPSLLIALAHGGNYVAAAFQDERVVGACVGFFNEPLGTSLHSHIAGVDAKHVGQGVGMAMKMHQRAWCVHRAIDMITWTFDPLVARNAYFNIERLGASLGSYLEDFYGPMRDGVNVGQVSDRVLVEWSLRPSSAAARPSAEVSPLDRLVLRQDADGYPYTDATDLPAGPTPRRAAIQIPSDIETLRRNDPQLAALWRAALRESYLHLTGNGFRVKRFDKAGYYLFEELSPDVMDAK